MRRSVSTAGSFRARIAAGKLLCAPILLALVLSFGIGAQTSNSGRFPPSGAPDAQSPFGEPQSLPDYDRPVSWKLVAPNILSDQKAIWLFPTKLAKDHNWIPALSVAGVTAGLLALDPYEGRYFHTTPRFQGFNRVFTSNATVLGTIAAPVSLYVAGLARRDTKMQHTALLAGEAVADAEILTTVLKDIDRRARPVVFTPHGNYWDSWFDDQGATLRGATEAFPRVML